jgi:hypothetical protein
VSTDDASLRAEFARMNGLPWTWERVPSGKLGGTRVRILDRNGRVVMSGGAKSDDDVDLLVRSVNMRGEP